MKRDKLELLSPAGNIEIFKSVVNAGADAVYFGGQMFGARAFAKNFTMEEGAEAISYAHLYGRKAYLTVNTLLKNVEIERKLYDYLKSYYEAGLDAVIVQDLGVLEFVKYYFPELAIHASTQMTVTNARGARWIQEAGASRVVTSRELSLREISGIYEATDVEIETFVHGALCVCYSGQCLMSSMLGGRSGNRGRCAQPCRLPYQLFDDKGKRQSMPGEYLLSPKDLCGIEDIAAMAEAGVYSFKIEGRMKQMAYAVGVVSLYRKYIDAYLEGRSTAVLKEDKQKIYDLGNRCGFTNTYFRHQNSPDMITYTRPSHEKKETTDIPANQPKILVQGDFFAHVGQKMELRVHVDEHTCVAVSEDIVEAATKKATVISEIDEKIKKTGNTPFAFEHLTFDVEDGVFIPVSRLNDLRRRALEQLQHQLQHQTNKRESVPFEKSALQPGDMSEAGDKEVLVCCDTAEQFMVACEKQVVSVVSISFDTALECFETLRQKAKQCGKKFNLTLPLICRQRAMELMEAHRDYFDIDRISGVIACSLDGLGFLEGIQFPKNRIQLDHRLYTLSNISLFAFEQRGYERFCAPLELNEKELSHRYNAHSTMLVYGRIPLMVTANCQHQNSVGCDKKPVILYLQDRYRERFPVKNRCHFCYNEIYNSKIYNILSEIERVKSLGFQGCRLDFTLEDQEETNRVLDQFEALWMGIENDKILQETSAIVTKGHFKRGVE
ncbi:MAG: U32 family peptidase [Lachnospiraceae bacterium]|nr:U32 family peptidase [Lachnospiraceae bacterium]